MASKPTDQRPDHHLLCFSAWMPVVFDVPLVVGSGFQCAWTCRESLHTSESSNASAPMPSSPIRVAHSLRHTSLTKHEQGLWFALPAQNAAFGWWRNGQLASKTTTPINALVAKRSSAQFKPLCGLNSRDYLDDRRQFLGNFRQYHGC